MLNKKSRSSSARAALQADITPLCSDCHEAFEVPTAHITATANTSRPHYVVSLSQACYWRAYRPLQCSGCGLMGAGWVQCNQIGSNGGISLSHHLDQSSNVTICCCGRNCQACRSGCLFAMLLKSRQRLAARSAGFRLRPAR